MDNCGSCDAKLTPDIQWCPQCYTPVGPPRPGAPGVPMTPAPQAVSGPSGSAPAPGAAASGLPPGQAPLPVWAQGSIRGHLAPALPEPAKFSRVKGGETSFGFFGRMMLSIGVVILGLCGYPAIMGNVGMPMSWTSFEIYLPGFLLVGGLVMLKVWKPARIDSRHR